MDLSLAFDAIPHVFSLTDVRSSWKCTGYGVPQRSQVSPRIFNIFLILFYFLEGLC